MEKRTEQEILINQPSFGEIEELTEETIFNDEIYYWLIAINSAGERQKQKRKLIKKADELGVKKDFGEFLKQCEKDFKREEKTINKNMQLKHNEVAEKILVENSIALYENDLFIYKNGFYSREEIEIERKIIEIIPDATSHFRVEVCKNLKLKLEPKEMFDREGGIINFKNGLFSIKEQKMYKHSPNFFSINQINTNLNFSAERVQAVDDVLNKLSSGIKGRKQTILEMIGYSMTTSVKLQKAFILYGNTARNGKSTLIDIIIHLLGDNNVGTVPFKEISKNKFAGAGIKGKLLNVGSEMTDEFIDDVSNFKMYITGDEVEIEEKFKPRQKIKPYAKFIFNANELPRVADKTDGFYRRLQIIPLEHSFTDKDAQNFNFNELISAKALEYLAKISLEAYLSMGETFSNCEESKKEVDKYKVNSNSVLTFINDEEYIYSIINKTSKVRNASEIYYLYRQYCTENQYKAVGMKKFYKEIEKSGLIEYVGNCNHQKTYTLNLNFYNTNPK